MDLPVLPAEIKQYIYCMLLKSTLDDIEDDDFQLVEINKPNIIMNFFGYVEKYSSVNNIEWYIKLLSMRPISSDINILSYKGRSICHLLARSITINNHSIVKDDHKFKILSKYGVDINKKDYDGNTISHWLIKILFKYKGFDRRLYNNITFLISLGMSIRLIKNNDGKTAYQIGEDIITAKRLDGKLDKIEALALMSVFTEFLTLETFNTSRQIY